MMKSMNVGAGPITTTPWFPKPQPMSEGSFMQTFQETVSEMVDGIAPPAAGVQPGSEVQTPQQDSANGSQPEVQDTEPKLQDARPKAQETEQKTQDTEAKAQDTQPQVQDVQPQTQEGQKTPEAQDVQQVQDVPQFAVSEDLTYEQVQTRPVQQAWQPELPVQDVSVNAPAIPTDGIEPDDEVMKELADLLSSKQDTLSAVEEMKQKLEMLMLQAFEDLTDPEKQQKEYEEKILEFLLKYIEKRFGGEDDKKTDHALEDPDEDETGTDIMDVLLQAVVQTLENIRSEDASADTPQENEEDVPEVGYVPPSKTVKEQVVDRTGGMLYEDTEIRIGEKQRAEGHEFRRPTTRAERIEPKYHDRDSIKPGPVQLPVHSEKPTDGEAVIPEAPKLTVDTEGMFDLHYRQTAESIFNELTQVQQPEVNPEQVVLPVQPLQPDQPMESVQPVQSAQSVQYAQLAQPVQPTQPEQSPRLAKAESTADTTAISAISPAEELEELTRLVRTGDSAKPEQPDFADHGEKTDQPKVQVKLPETGEAIPFEAAIATAKSDPVLTRSFGLEGSSAQQIVTQIASEIFNQLPESGGNTTFVMTLNPETLGRVTVKLVEEAGKLSVTVTAHSRQTAELLSARLENLQTAMKENGTQLEKYQVVYAPEKDEGSGQQNYEGSSKNPYIRQDDEEGVGGDEFAELLKQAV